MTLEIATFEALYSQPLKSGASQLVDQHVLTASGALEGDRDYILVEDVALGQFGNRTNDLVFPFISGRKDPAVALIDVELDGDETWFSSRAPWLTDLLHAPVINDSDDARIRIKIHDSECIGVDQGNNAADCASLFVQRAVRLARFSEQFPRFVMDTPDFGITKFADGFPLTVTTEESIAEVQEALEGVRDFGVANVRPNWVLSGLPARSEYRIKNISIESEDGFWTVVGMKACSRCVMVENTLGLVSRPVEGVLDVMQELGLYGVHKDQKFGKNPKTFFSQNCIILPPKDAKKDTRLAVSVGQEVLVELSDEDNWEYRTPRSQR